MQNVEILRPEDSEALCCPITPSPNAFEHLPWGAGGLILLHLLGHIWFPFIHPSGLSGQRQRYRTRASSWSRSLLL